MYKSLDEVYNEIQLKRLEKKKIEESKINELRLIKERQMRDHINDMRRHRISAGGLNKKNAYVVNGYIDDYLL